MILATGVVQLAASALIALIVALLGLLTVAELIMRGGDRRARNDKRASGPR